MIPKRKHHMLAPMGFRRDDGFSVVENGISSVYESIIKRLSFFDGVDIMAPLIENHFRGRIALVSSFGAESAVLLHMASQIDRSVPVIFLDTGKLFWETIAYRSKLVDRLGLTDIRTIKPDAEELAQSDPDGMLHKTNPDMFC